MIKYLSLLFSVATAGFLSVGDWGSAAIGGQHLQNVQAIAKQMNMEKDTDFVLSTGDNFYYCGIQSIYDPQVSEDYGKLFADSGVNWYNSLGNHDYGYNVSAQLDLNKIYSNWIMPDRYYKQVLISDQTNIILFVLDTNPCIQDYRNDNPDYWDPCSTRYPTCSLDDTNDDFEGECKFHQNILTQSCQDQFNWFHTEIQDAYREKNDDTVLIVIGHHPIYEINVLPFYPLVDQFADLYLNGHTHLLNHYSVNGKAKYITTGAGGMVSVASGTTVEHEEPNIANVVSHTVVWTQRVAGYTRHSIVSSNNTKQIKTEFVSWNGKVIYEFTTF